MLIGHGLSIFEVLPDEAMGGYVDRGGGVEGIHDELEVHAVTFRDQDRSFALVVADLVCVNVDVVAAVRHAVAATHGIEACWVAATHTHAGPETGCRPGGASTPPTVSARLVQTASNAVGRALATEAEATLSLSRSQIPGVAGRRAYDATDSLLPVDALAIHSPAGLVGVLVMSPIHPTVQGSSNRLCSADLNGAIRRALTTRLAAGGRAPWVTVATGAAGDISTRHTRRARTWEEIDRLGGLLADALARQLDDPTNRATAAPQSGLSTPHAATIELRPKLRSGALTSSPAQNSATAAGRNSLTYQQGLQIAAEIIAGARGTPYSVQLQAVRIGGIDLLAVPAELFLSLGEDIRAAAPSPNEFALIGYANGYLGYLPNRAAFTDPAYEVLASPVEPGSGETFVQAAVELLDSSRAHHAHHQPRQENDGY